MAPGSLEPLARLELGRLALEAGRSADARAWFDGVARTKDPVLAERGRMYTAVAAQRAGDNEHALSVLKPLLGRTVDPQETSWCSTPSAPPRRPSATAWLR